MILKTIEEGKNIVDDSQAFVKTRNKSFFVERSLCHYQNTLNFSIDPSRNKKNNISISNHVCQRNGDLLEKVTKIRFEEQEITIKDEYFFRRPIPKQRLSKQDSKLTQMEKETNRLEKQRGKIAKNLPKNFIKAFLNYLNKRKRDKDFEAISKQLQKLKRKGKYDLYLLQRILDDDNLSPQFFQFLQKSAQKWILRSKIQKKKQYLKVINFFLKVYQKDQEETLERKLKVFLGFMPKEEPERENHGKNEQISDSQQS